MSFHGLMMAFHGLCMTSMVFMCYDPNLATWAANWATHMVQGFAGIPQIGGDIANGTLLTANGFNTAAAATTSLPPPPPYVPDTAPAINTIAPPSPPVAPAPHLPACHRH